MDNKLFDTAYNLQLISTFEGKEHNYNSNQEQQEMKLRHSK